MIVFKCDGLKQLVRVGRSEIILVDTNNASRKLKGQEPMTNSFGDDQPRFAKTQNQTI